MPGWSKLEFLIKFSADTYVLSDANYKTSRLLNRGDIADLTFVENTISNSNEVSGKH